MSHFLNKLILPFALLLALWILPSCATAPRITIDQVPVLPGATRLADGTHLVTPSTITDIEKTHADIRRNFDAQGAHAQAAFRVPAETATPQDISGWYYKNLTANGWRSRYAIAYTDYVNGAGQNLTVYVLSNAPDTKDTEILLMLDDSQ